MEKSDKYTHVSARSIGSGLVLSTELRSRIDRLFFKARARTEASHPEKDLGSKSGVGGKMGFEGETLQNSEILHTNFDLPDSRKSEDKA